MICSPSRCCGCMACGAVCPVGAISAKKDEYGFTRPVIDPEKCVECSLCEKVCPENKKTNKEVLSAFAAYNKDRDVRLESSSGGIFSLLSEDVLNAGGAVCGCAFGPDFMPEHIIVTAIDDLCKLRGSKYVQSETADVWKQIKELLDGGRKVLFSGTPCQCAALSSYLGREYDNLLMVDIICHGVPTPRLWKSYIDENFSDIKSVSMRSKDKGWHHSSLKVEDGRGTYRKGINRDPYLRIFLGNCALRECCFDCNFKGGSYFSDITLGDFWGINRLSPEMNDDKGISAVIVRSEKGRAAFDAIGDRIQKKECTVSDISRGNGALNKSSNRRPESEDVMEMIKNGEPFADIAKKYAAPAPLSYVIKSELKFVIMQIAGRLLSLVRK